LTFDYLTRNKTVLKLARNADENTREYYRSGISANTTGISVYLSGFEDKNYLARTYGKEPGKCNWLLRVNFTLHSYMTKEQTHGNGLWMEKKMVNYNHLQG